MLTASTSTNINTRIATLVESSKRLDQKMPTDIPSEFVFLIIEDKARVEFLEVSRAVFQVQLILDSVYRMNTTESGHRVIIDEEIRAIQYKLMLLGNKATYSKALCISIRIFLILVRPQSRTDDNSLQPLVIRLKESLESPHICFCSALETIFWQLTIGAVASSEPIMRQWFLITLKKLLPSLYLRSWDDAKQVLQKFFWIDHIFSSPCSDLWDELVDH